MFACISCPQLSPDALLSDFAYQFSPLVEETKPNVVVIDVDGCELVFGSAYQLAHEVSQRSVETKIKGGLETKADVALAANPDAAIHAASCLKGITFIEP